MKVIADQIYPQAYQAFQTLLKTLDQPDTVSKAAPALQNILLSLTGKEATSEGIQASFFANAFQKRLQGESGQAENLYLLPDFGQQIQMFNFMVQKFPMVRYAQEIINAAYLPYLQSQTDIVIWDIGIGNGQQVSRLLNSLLEAGTQIQKMTVIGLDPSSDSLSQAEKTLTEQCGDAQIEFQFVAFPQTVESLSSQDWRKIETLLTPKQGQWIANASFALHHTHPIEYRTEFFKKIKTYQPALFGLIEPYADFLTDELTQRFAHAWHHYGLAFWTIDQIDAPLENKNLLKSIFFGREIVDVIGKDEGRIEQFETGEMWTHRLKEAGFALEIPQGLPAAIPNFPTVGVQAFETFVGFTAQQFPIVSLMLAR